MSDSGRSRLDALRAPVGGESESTLDPLKLIAYHNAFDQLPAEEQQACLARLRRGDSYEQIALDLGEGSAVEARVTVTRAMDRLLRDVLGGTAPRSERLSDLLGNETSRVGEPENDGAPAGMTLEEEAILRELFVLSTIEPALERWGKFTDLKEIGAGGFGTVYSAMDPVLQTRVALKLYHPHRSQRPTEELLGEARKLARVRHPNVVVVHGVEEIDGRVGVWMELVEGNTLEDEVRAGSRLDAEAAAEVGIALCQALEAVHAAGIVHGDIKAQNVVRGTDGRIVLMDFGAARFRDPSAVEAKESRAGTPAYMAPDLFKFRGDRLVEPTVQSDVYAVGVLLFYLVTGKFPVQGDSAEEIRRAHDRGERMLLLSQEAPDLLEDLARVIETALARTPEQRWLTVAEMGQELVASTPEVDRGITLQRVARVAAWAAGAAAIIWTLGFGATRVFEVALHIDPEFAPSTPGYFIAGTEALLPFVALWGVTGFVLGIGMFLVYFALKLGARLPPIGGRWIAALQSVDPKITASCVFLLGLGLWVAITWAYSDVWEVADGLRMGTIVDYSVLGPKGNRFNRAYGRDSAILSFMLALVARLWFPRLERRVVDAAQVRLLKWATVAVACIAVASVAMLYQLIWQSFVVVQLPDRQAYVVGYNDEELLLFSPRTTDRRYLRVAGDDNSIETLDARRLFDEEGDENRRSVP